jgi:hypothetical protein
MTRRTGRNVSANTHFEEWWFKTFLSLFTAMAAVHTVIKPVLMGAGFFAFRN